NELFNWNQLRQGGTQWQNPGPTENLHIDGDKLFRNGAYFGKIISVERDASGDVTSYWVDRKGDWRYDRIVNADGSVEIVSARQRPEADFDPDPTRRHNPEWGRNNKNWEQKWDHQFRRFQ